jgi:nitrogen fixation protein
MGSSGGPQVPLQIFTAQIRSLVEHILIADHLVDTKVLLIGTTPLDLSPTPPVSAGKVSDDAVAIAKAGLGFRNYMMKKAYSAAMVQVAREYEETGRVLGLDGWRVMVDAALAVQGRRRGDGEEEEDGEERLPGCGVPGAEGFPQGWFRDGLHPGSEVSRPLSVCLNCFEGRQGMSGNGACW